MWYLRCNPASEALPRHALCRVGGRRTVSASSVLTFARVGRDGQINSVLAQRFRLALGVARPQSASA